MKPLARLSTLLLSLSLSLLLTSCDQPDRLSEEQIQGLMEAGYSGEELSATILEKGVQGLVTPGLPTRLKDAGVSAEAVAVVIANGLRQDDIERLETIMNHLGAGDAPGAIALGEAYVADYPESYEGWKDLGWSYVKGDYYEEGREALEKAISIDSRGHNAYVGLGAILRRENDLEGAREMYLKAINIQPENPEAYGSLVAIEIIEGNDAKAVEYGLKAWEMSQDNASIPANLSIAYHYLGDFKKRDEFYNYAKDMNYPYLEGMEDIFSGKASLR